MGAMDLVKNHYIKEILARGVREDGRGMFDFRNMKIVPGVIDHAEGSAQVDLGNTRVLAGVKMQVDEPMPDTPNQGNQIMSAELLPLAHAEYETGPPSPEAIELARVVDRGIRAANCIDLEGLFLEEGKVWSVFADIYVLNYDGNLFDASTLAVMAALMNARVPDYKDGKADYTNKATPLKINSVVASTTFCKLDRSLLLDPDMHEEGAADCRITITTDGEGVRAMQKGMSGSLSTSEIEKLVDLSFDKYREVKKKLEESSRRRD